MRKMNRKTVIATISAMAALAAFGLFQSFAHAQAGPTAPVVATPSSPTDTDAQLTANASWSDIDRKPATGSLGPGVYIWRDRPVVYITLKGPNGTFAGRIEGNVIAPVGGLSHLGTFGDPSQDRIDQ